MVHMLAICMLVHGMAAMTDTTWGAAVLAKDEQAATSPRSDPQGCYCWNTTEQQVVREEGKDEEEKEVEVEEVADCRCKGSDLLYVPEDIHPSLQAL
jgi:hypothetical protein